MVLYMSDLRGKVYGEEMFIDLKIVKSGVDKRMHNKGSLWEEVKEGFQS